MEVFERPARPLETYKVRNKRNCRDHSSPNGLQKSNGNLTTPNDDDCFYYFHQ